MDLQIFLNDLQAALRLHDRALGQILYLDAYIKDACENALLSAASGQSHTVTRLMFQKSIAEGVKQMYKHYRRQKWNQVQTMVQGYMGTQNPDSPLSLPDNSPIGNPEGEGEDSLAQSWTLIQSDLSRYS